MLEFGDIQSIVAEAFFNGDQVVAGVLMFTVVLAVMFALTKNVFQTLVLAMPVTFIFSVLGILSSDMTILLIIVVVLGLALTSGRVLTRKE